MKNNRTNKTQKLLNDLGEGQKYAEMVSAELASEVTSNNVTEASYNPVEQVGVSVTEIQQACKADLNILAGLCMPNVFTFLYPDHFISAWQWLTEWAEKERVFPQLALGLPRGFAKSTLMKLFLVYCILFTNKKFLLVLAATAKLAENIIADVIDMLEEPNIVEVFGDWRIGIEKDTQGLKKFGYRGRTIIIAGLGAEGNVRGINLKNERPDVMLFDDIQSRECADSETQSTSLEQWFVGTAMKAKSPMGCMFLFVANMYPTKHSLLRKLKHNPRWLKYIVGGLLADGTSLWEELQPKEQLIAEYENDLAMGRPEVFLSEVLNDENANASKLINLANLPMLPYEEGDISAGNFIIIDPSNDKKDSDDVAIGYFEIYEATPTLMECTSDKLSPGDIIRVALSYALKHNCSLIAVESNAFQYSLLYWFKHICKQRGITGIHCVDIYSGNKAKTQRILKMLHAYAAGEIFVDHSCRLLVHNQITEFNPLVTDNTDDLLDLLTYAPRVVQEYGQFVIGGNIIEAQEYDAIEVEEYNTEF